VSQFCCCLGEVGGIWIVEVAKLGLGTEAVSLPKFLVFLGGDEQKIGRLLDLCVSSLRRGHANLLCIVIL